MQTVCSLMNCMISCVRRKILDSGKADVNVSVLHNLKSASVINGCSGSDNICHEFTRYFKSVVTPNSAQADEKYKKMVNDQIRSLPVQTASRVDVNLLYDCTNNMKTNKAAGYDGVRLSVEHIKYGGIQLLVHLCLLFNAMIVHSFVPADFRFGMIMMVGP